MKSIINKRERLVIGLQLYLTNYMEDVLFEKIKMFVEKQRWKYDFPLTKETRLEEDLNIYGDDSVDFLIAFGTEFNVDVSKFMAADYFSGEGWDLGDIIRFITGRKKPEKKILTLGHLEKAIKAGRLDEEIINTSTQ